MDLVISSRPRAVRRRSELRVNAVRDELAAAVERTALGLIDPDRIEALADDLHLIERRRVHHVGLVVAAVVLSAMQRSTDTQGRWLDAQVKYEELNGAESGKTSFRNQVIKMVPVMRELLRRRLAAFAEATDHPELRGRLKAFADVLIPDGCAFKLASALSNVYAGTGQPAELKLHAVYSVRAGGVVSVAKTAGSVHDSDGFWPEKWVCGGNCLAALPPPRRRLPPSCSGVGGCARSSRPVSSAAAVLRTPTAAGAPRHGPSRRRWSRSAGGYDSSRASARC